MNHVNIIIGLLLIAGSIVYLINVIKRFRRIENGDYIRYSNYIKIYAGYNNYDGHWYNIDF